MSAQTIPWEQYQNLPPEKRSRPLTDAEFAALTKQQRIAAGLDEDSSGAPTNFAGAVFPNPDGIKPQLDTDNNVPVTRLPLGVTLQHENYGGGASSDLSNPQPADVQPELLQTIGTKMSAAPIDFSKYEAAPAIDFSKYDGSPAAAPPAPGMLDRVLDPIPDVGIGGAWWAPTVSGLQSVSRGIRDTIKGTVNAFDPTPQNPEEEAVAAQKVQGVPGTVALPAYRILRAAGHTAEDSLKVASAIHDINNSPDPVGTYAKALQEMAGQGAAQALTAAATEGLIKGIGAVAPKVAGGAGRVLGDLSGTKITAPVRAAVRGVNKVLQKAPGSIGASVGGAAGAITHIPGAAELGAGAGYAIGKEVLPQIKVPGEGFGLPNSVEGGPASAPQYQATPLATPKTLADLGNPTTPPKVTLGKVPAKLVRQSKALGPDAAVRNQAETLGQLTPPKTIADLADPKPPAPVATTDPILAQLRANAAKIQAAEASPKVPAADEDLTEMLRKSLGQTKVPSADEDLSELLQKSLEQAVAKKSGVPTTASPSALVKRWGVDEQSILDTDADVRGMSEKQSAKYLDKLVDSYKNGRKVDPVVETRDAENNIVSVDGRHRALAAQKAGVERIPIIVRRMKTISALQ